MTLDEAIARTTELKEKEQDIDCQKDFEQLLEWFKELKDFRANDTCQHKRLATLGVCSDYDCLIYQDSVSLRYRKDCIKARTYAELSASGFPHLCVCLDCGAVFVKELMPGQSDIRDRLNKQD